MFDFSDILDDKPAPPPADAREQALIPVDDKPAPPPADAREQALAPIGPDGRLRPIYLQPIELASEGLIQLYREAARSDLATILLPEAIRTLAVVMRDAHASPNARVTAARAVLSVALTDSSDVAVKKALHEMTASEIDAAIQALRSEVVERAAPAPPQPLTIEADDWFDLDFE